MSTKSLSLTTTSSYLDFICCVSLLGLKTMFFLQNEALPLMLVAFTSCADGGRDVARSN